MKKAIKAFTLLEALVAIVVISGGLVLFQALTKTLFWRIHSEKSKQFRSWALLSQQLTEELSKGPILSVKDNQIVYQDKGQVRRLAFYPKKGDIRKTDQWGQGYSPMVYGIQDFKVKQEGTLVRIQVTFQSGLEREFIYESQKP